MKETAFLPSFLFHQSKSTVIWCYTGAGYGYKENYKQIINLNRNAIPIIIIFSNAGALVANRYGFFWNLGQTTIEKDLILYERLLTGSGHGHWSPFEHVAEATDMTEERYNFVTKKLEIKPIQCGNFQGWIQYRKTCLGIEGILAINRLL